MENTFDKVIKAICDCFVKAGMSDENASTFVSYMDSGDPSLIEKVKKQQLDYREAYSAARLVMTYINVYPDENITMRFAAFCYALVGTECGKYIFPSDAALDEELLKKALTPFLEDDAASAAYACILQYCYDYSRKQPPKKDPATVYEAGRFFGRFEKVQNHTYMHLLHDAYRKKNNEALQSAAGKICSDIISSLDNTDILPHADTEFDLLLAEASLMSDEISTFFKAYCTQKSRLIRGAAAEDMHEVIEMMCTCDELVDEEVISSAAWLNSSRYSHYCGKLDKEMEYLTDTYPGLCADAADRSDIAVARYISDLLSVHGHPSPDIKNKARDMIVHFFEMLCPDIKDLLIPYITEGRFTSILEEKLHNAVFTYSGDDIDIDYCENFGCDDFIVRCFAVLSMIKIKNPVSRFIRYNIHGYIGNEKAKGLFGGYFATEFSVETLLDAMQRHLETHIDTGSVIAQSFADGLAENSDRLDGLSAAALPAPVKFVVVRAMKQSPDRFRAMLLSLADDSSAVIRSEITDILSVRTDWHDDIEALLFSKRSRERDLAVDVILRQGKESYSAALRKAYLSEKTDKIKDRLRSVLGAETVEDEPLDETVEKLTKGAKMKKVAWVFDAPVREVHKKDGTAADEKYLSALMLCYANMKTPGVSPTGKRLAEELDPKELALFAADLFKRWAKDYGPAKIKWVIYFAFFYIGDPLINTCLPLIKEWVLYLHSSAACETVRARALSGTPRALRMVDDMSRNFKQKSVRTAAGNVMREVAEQLGMTSEELGDILVPELGFDENLSRVLDYGPRQFRIQLAAGDKLEIYSGDKLLRSLPKPAASDDPEKAQAAAAEFKELKKLLRTEASIQKTRLENVLMNERRWSPGKWRSLFVGNALMHSFAEGLVWGIYTPEGVLTETFRYMDDGSFNTLDEEELDLPESGEIGLVHPLELTEEQLAGWRSQLEDYEISQPFPQIEREVFRPTDEELSSESLSRFNDIKLNSLTLIGRMTRLGWIKGRAGDGAYFYEFYRDDISGKKVMSDGSVTLSGVRTQLSFSGCDISGYDREGEEVTITGVSFYPPCTDAFDAPKKRICDISPRYFSEAVYQLTRALGTAVE